MEATMWHDLTVAEMAAEVVGHAASQTSEPVSQDEAQAWIEANIAEVNGYMLAPHAIAARILAERD